MIVQCEHCKTKFRLADDRISNGGVKVRCSKCAHVFTVSRGARDGRIEAQLVDPTASVRPMSPLDPPGDALASDLMLPPAGALGGAPPTGHGGGRPALSGSALDAAWPSALSPPQSFGASLPPLPFDVGPPPPISPIPSNSRPPQPPPRSVPPPSIPAGRPPPGHTLPSVPRSMLDIDASDSASVADLDPAGDGRTEVSRAVRASTELSRSPAMGRGPTQLDPLRSPPQARAQTELERAMAAPPLSGPRSSPPRSLSPQSIKAPTFPPPPEFDPLGGPLASVPPPPAVTQRASIPPADSDRFSLPRSADPLADLGPASDMFGGAFVGGSAAQMGDGAFDPGDEAPNSGGAKLARIELRKGLLGQAGYSSLGAANDMTTRIAASMAKVAPDDDELLKAIHPWRGRLAPLLRNGLLFAGLFALVAAVVFVASTRRETWVGEPSLLESVIGRPPPLVSGALPTAYVQSAHVTSYPPRDPRPRLVVSGHVANGGAEVQGLVEVVASMLDGERIVAQRQAPLGALLPLDVLAGVRSAAELDAAWALVEAPAAPWATGEARPFMVVFPELPAEVARYTFRVDVRPVSARLGAR